MAQEGQKVGHYRLLSVLGSGESFGIVGDIVIGIVGFFVAVLPAYFARLTYSRFNEIIIAFIGASILILIPRFLLRRNR